MWAGCFSRVPWKPSSKWSGCPAWRSGVSPCSYSRSARFSSTVHVCCEEMFGLLWSDSFTKKEPVTSMRDTAAISTLARPFYNSPSAAKKKGTKKRSRKRSVSPRAEIETKISYFRRRLEASSFQHWSISLNRDTQNPAVTERSLVVRRNCSFTLGLWLYFSITVKYWRYRRCLWGSSLACLMGSWWGQMQSPAQPWWDRQLASSALGEL